LEVEFPLGLEGTTGLPQTRRALKNCFNAGGRIIQRPGITQLNTTSKVARGIFEWNDTLYGVATTDLFSINTTTGAQTSKGTIAGGTPIDTAIGFNHAVILDTGGNGYTFDSSETLTQITDPQFVSSDSVCHINGRFVYIPSDGSPAFYSDVGDGSSIQATSFFDAEELPDKNKVCFNFKNTLYIGGTDSFELFRNLGGAVDFSRLNARIDNGYLGGILEYNNTFLFIGREKDQDVGIYSIGQGIAPKISNEYIDTILKTYTTEELGNCKSGRIKWNGYDLAVFTLSRHSWGFYGGNWFDLSYMDDGEEKVWQGGYITEFNQKYYSHNSDKIGRFDAINKEYGANILRLMDFGFEADAEFTAQSLEYRLSQGYSDADGSVALQLSDDNVTYSQPFHRNTGDIGEYSNKLIWDYPGGLGYYDGFMGIRLSSAEDIDFSASKVLVNLR
jgi:hypothetical protein